MRNGESLGASFVAVAILWGIVGTFTWILIDATYGLWMIYAAIGMASIGIIVLAGFSSDDSRDALLDDDWEE